MARKEVANRKWSIRPAAKADAYQLAEIKNAGQRHELPGEHRAAEHEALDFLDRLALPHGDDYFCVVAEQDDRIIGYLTGGGSRDPDRKAHGEVYEIAVLPASRRQGVARALLGYALERFDAAAFAGTLISAPTDDDVIRRLAAALGMREDRKHGDGGSTTRYERALQATDHERRDP